MKFACNQKVIDIISIVISSVIAIAIVAWPFIYRYVFNANFMAHDRFGDPISTACLIPLGLALGLATLLGVFLVVAACIICDALGKAGWG